MAGFSSNVHLFNRARFPMGSFPLRLFHHEHGGGGNVQAASWCFHDHQREVTFAVLSPSEKYGGHEQHFWIRSARPERKQSRQTCGGGDKREDKLADFLYLI